MAQSTMWWILAGGAVALELVTGTFYLLMLAIGLAAGALAAHAGLAPVGQIVTAAVIGAGAVVAWYYVRKAKYPLGPQASSNPDVNMDVGETVNVEAWNTDGTANVKYRGAQWTVISRPGNNPVPGQHRVAEVIGNRLLVDKL
jgi:membrane protein implicated in regulation of membrane protease activity